MVRLERTVLQQRNSRYEVQGDFLLPAGGGGFPAVGAEGGERGVEGGPSAAGSSVYCDGV